MSKFYIGFPISFHCSLRCAYCYNKEFYDFIDTGKIGTNKWRDKRTFTFEDYRRWRDKHLSDSTDLIMHLFGGEPFCKQNVEDVFNIFKSMDKERFDILSNGICDAETISRLKEFKLRFHRIGFTYHRESLIKFPELKKRFENNVMLVKDMGIKVYVKELMIKENRDLIISNKRWWLSKGVDFKIQDFKGGDRGLSQEEYEKYTPLDHLLIDPEYKHSGNECSCIAGGYKNLFIRGFDMADVVGTNGSDIIACWQMPTVIGNILDDWFCTSYIIAKDFNGKIIVKNAPELFRGTHKYDLPIK